MFSVKKLYLETVHTVLFFVLAMSAFSQSLDDVAPPKPNHRPSVALVLGGGGARGFAHVPVLEVIDELNIPIDMIIGNSAGSIVGGLYSIGYKPKEMVDILNSFNWAELFVDRPTTSFEHLLEDRSIFSSPFHLRLGNDFNFDIEGGLSTGQNAYMALKSLTVRIPSYVDFDAFPIPFRAVAVDLISRKLNVIGSGDLAEAIRSSMSIPVLFEPFPIGDKLFVDGMVQSNLPIQEAVNLGYDIIIAVSLDDELVTTPEQFSASPMNTIAQVWLIVTNTNEPEVLDQATVIIHPKLGSYSSLDYFQGEKIYELAASHKDEYRQSLLKIKNMIYPSGTEEDHPQEIPDYETFPYSVPRELVIKNALDADIPLIETLFESAKNQPLTEESVNQLIQPIYETGHYSLVIPRIDTRTANHKLELKLYPLKQESIILIPSVDYQGLLANSSFSELTISLNTQFRNITGIGSILALKLNLINRIACDLLYLKSLGYKSYFKVSSKWSLDKEITSSGFVSLPINENKISYAGVNIGYGIHPNKQNSFITEAAFTWMDPSKILSDFLEKKRKEFPQSQASMAGTITVQYTFDNLDNYAFPSDGVKFGIKNVTGFPIQAIGGPIAFNTSTIDFTTAFPFTKYSSFIWNTRLSSDVSLQLHTVPDLIPMFGFSLGDRMYFPNIPNMQRYGTHNFVTQLVYQLKPWQNITILGGQIFFNITGTFGIIAMDQKDFTLNSINWNASLGSGLRLNERFSIMLRVGAGSTANGVQPFISFDLGSLRY